MFRPMKKVLALYGSWALLWLAIAVLGSAFSGHGEYGICAHLILAFTGLPLGLLSLHAPNGTALGVALAGVIGTAQWCAVAELNHRWERWQSARKNVN